MQDVIKKLKFKEAGVIVNAPEAISKKFEQFGCKPVFGDQKSGSTLFFVNNKQELLHFLEADLKQVEPDSVLWYAYPKGTSKVKTDINRDSIRAIGETFGITTVAAISIDETWSALRFRPIDKVGK